MSTRATYEFKAPTDWRQDTTIYIHHDGYEVGAANYFYNAFLAGGMNAEAMIRGNHKAEITTNHEGHGDTEYRYTVNRDLLTVTARDHGWEAAWSGDWVDFINKHLATEYWGEGEFQPLKRVTIAHASEVHTPTTLKAKLDEDLRLCGQWTTNGVEPVDRDSANMTSLKARIAVMRALLTAYGDPAWKEAA